MSSAFDFGYQLGYHGLTLVVSLCIVQFLLKPKYFNQHQKEMSGWGYFIRLSLIFVLLTLFSMFGR